MMIENFPEKLVILIFRDHPKSGLQTSGAGGGARRAGGCRLWWQRLGRNRRVLLAEPKKKMDASSSNMDSLSGLHSHWASSRRFHSGVMVGGGFDSN
jgi:hypothetical protein